MFLQSLTSATAEGWLRDERFPDFGKSIQPFLICKMQVVSYNFGPACLSSCLILSRSTLLSILPLGDLGTTSIKYTPPRSFL